MIRRRSHSLLLILTALCFTVQATAQQADALVSLGDKAYARKAYDSAVTYYEAATNGRNADAAVLYKLGNAHYRLRHTGEAVLAYERALKMRPDFAAAAENLAVIQKQIQPVGPQTEVFFIRWWRVWISPSRSNTWAVAGALLFLLPVVTLCWSRFQRKRISWLRPQLTTAFIALAAGCIILSIFGAYNNVPVNAAVVMRPGAAFRATGSGNKQSITSLPEGMIVNVIRKDREQLMVALPDGQSGAMQRSDIALVE